ncbi:MAG: hypothetical protein V4620_07150 [Bacteroidota bacterium]
MKFVIFSLLVFSWGFSKAQNIFDYEHNIAYAKYLFEHKDYKQVLGILNTFDSNTNNKNEIAIWKVRCYLNLKQYAETDYILQSIQADAKHKPEYDFLLLKNSLLSNNINKYNSYAFDSTNALIAELLCYREFYTKGIDSAIVYTQKNIHDTLLMQYMVSTFKKARLTYHYKKPWMAATLSVLPGLGQIYTRQYADAYLGLIPFYLHGAIAYMAFSQAGIQSVFGWLNTAMASGFYIGNIYGAAQSAKRINQINFIKTNDEIKKRISSLEF